MQRTEKRRRSNGSGTIFIRNGYYLWRYVTPDNETKTITLKSANGERVTNKETAQRIVSEKLLSQNRSVAEAESLRSTAEVVTKLATLKGLINTCTLSVAELWQSWQSSPSYSTGNETTKKAAVRHFTAWSIAKYGSAVTVAEISPTIAALYLAEHWQSGISARSWNIRLNQLDIVFRAVAGDSPFAGIAKKREEPESREAFSVAQLASIWQTLQDDNFYMKDKAEMTGLYITALHTGLRCGDCCMLRWDDVDLDKSVISLTPSKTSHSSRRKIVIPITTPLHDALLAQLANKDETGFVFPNVSRRYQQCPSAISAVTTRLLEAAGMTTKEAPQTKHRQRCATRYGFHSFRHTTASLLANAGVSPLVIRDILGHSSVNMTSHYSHISIESKTSALSSIFSDDDTSADTSIASVVKALKQSSMSKLASYLESTLSPSQKREIMTMFS